MPAKLPEGKATAEQLRRQAYNRAYYLAKRGSSEPKQERTDLSPGKLSAVKRSVSPEAPVGDLPATIDGATRRAYRWPKESKDRPGNSAWRNGNRGPREFKKLTREVRRLCINASPAMAEGLIDLANNSADDRVRSVCMLAILDRAGIRPLDKPLEDEEGKVARRFDPRGYTEEELVRIEEALLLLTDPARARALQGDAAGGVEVIAPGEDGGGEDQG